MDPQLLNLFFRTKMPGMIRLAERAAHHVEDLIKTHDIDCDYEQTGNVCAAVSRGQMGQVRRVTKILERAGCHVALGTSEELGIPRGFLGGMREEVGGIMNPGRFTTGVRRALIRSSARVFEKTKVTDVTRDGGQVVLTTPQGEVRADKVVLATNAYAGEWDITPPRLSVPIWASRWRPSPSILPV
ncbi:glycine/D-amino acid oxidase-like deaminating enzyme [Streptomyces sp. V3I7]|nr:glycine/D-amino acid oxidase-like deaminating enzyme [Streptomyces sp. V3I7]